jgi:hypothetical protein
MSFHIGEREEMTRELAREILDEFAPEMPEFDPVLEANHLLIMDKITISADGMNKIVMYCGGIDWEME